MHCMKMYEEQYKTQDKLTIQAKLIVSNEWEFPKLHSENRIMSQPVQMPIAFNIVCQK
jgi:hypothetical protein